MVRFDYGVVLIESLKKSAPQAGGFLDAKAVARTHSLSPSYMEKVAQELKNAGWLESRRGAGGGYRLKNQAVSVSDLINLFERPYDICPINRIL